MLQPSVLQLFAHASTNEQVAAEYREFFDIVSGPHTDHVARAHVARSPQLNWCATAAIVASRIRSCARCVQRHGACFERRSGGSSAALSVRLQFCQVEPGGYARWATT